MKLKTPLFLAILLILTPLHAQKFNSGDQQLDRWLININFAAKENTEQYLAKIARKYKVDKAEFSMLREEFEYSPADLCALLGLAKTTKLDFEQLQNVFSQYRDRGYKSLMQAAGVTKNSKQFTYFKSFIEGVAPKRDLEAESRNIFIKKKPK